jgi:hypothetical protein
MAPRRTTAKTAEKSRKVRDTKLTALSRRPHPTHMREGTRGC